MRKNDFIKADVQTLVRVVMDLVWYMRELLNQARQASSDPVKEKEILRRVADVHGDAAALARQLNIEDVLPAIPLVEDNRVLACCPACGQEDREDTPWAGRKIRRLEGSNWSISQLHGALPDPGHQQHVTQMVSWKHSPSNTQFKTTVLECGACRHREEALTIDGLDSLLPQASDETRHWWATQHPEILLLMRWQVPEARMAIFDRKHSSPKHSSVFFPPVAERWMIVLPGKICA